MPNSPSNVDVVIPVYNGAVFVAEAIESVLKQNPAPKSIIVVDDCSTDETPSILKAFGSSIHAVRHEKNRGVAAARNTGIRLGYSELIAFHDADDIWIAGKLGKQLRQFQENNEIGLCYTDMSDCDLNLSQIRKSRKFRSRVAEYVFKELYKKAFSIPTSTVIVRREVFQICGMFDESLQKAEDYECWLRIAMKFPISCIAEPLCLRRNNPNSLSNTSTVEKDVYFTFRAFELCGYAASNWGIKLPIPVKERKKLYLYRALQESISWGKSDEAAFFKKKLEETGTLGIKRRIVLRLLEFLMRFKSTIKPLLKT